MSSNAKPSVRRILQAPSAALRPFSPGHLAVLAKPFWTPKLPVIWIEAGLAWVPFLMQRLDHEFMLRPSECPLLKRKPSEYMREMYYSSQPMEIQDMDALECTFRMIDAENSLLYASDYPHWDFDLPSTIWDLPFLTDRARHNILGGTAHKLFKLPPRNEAQKQNLIKYGNYIGN
jgi:predicted TIM-barrel fold metal-dependent hydrolase